MHAFHVALRLEVTATENTSFTCCFPIVISILAMMTYLSVEKFSGQTEDYEAVGGFWVIGLLEVPPPNN